METKNIPITGLIKTLNEYLEPGIGLELLNQVVLSYYHDNPIKTKDIISMFIDDEWIGIKLEMQIKSKLMTLENELRAVGRQYTMNSFKVNNLGVTIHVTKQND